MTSVNTNYGALVALQNLNATTRELNTVQGRINSGLKVASAADNGAVFAIAQGQRARVSGLAAVKDGLDRAMSVLGVGISAGEQIGELLTQMKEKATAAQATDLSTEQRNALNADFEELRDQVNRVANSAKFNGTNLVNGTATGINQLSPLTSDLSQAAPYTLSGTALGQESTSAATLADAGLTLEAGDAVEITINGNTYSIAVAGTDTIQNFLDDVAELTGGRVTANFDLETQQITYSSNAAFSVGFLDADAGGEETGAFFDATGSAAAELAATANTGAAATMDITSFNFTLGAAGGPLASITSSTDIDTTAEAETVSGLLDTAIATLNENLATMGAQARSLEGQKSFLTKLSDSIEKGIGQLVDADLAKESARLQSLQVKQQLGAQALSIANQAPSIVLSFFR
ncbi:MAG: flagellin [Hyphomonadaceae bacterium]